MELESRMSNFVMCPINSDGTFGEPIKLEGLTSIDEFSEEGTVYPGQVSFNTFKETQFTGAFCIPHTKMSRKTFKKWLMSKGISRDHAEWFCNVVKYYKGKHSYHDLYFVGLFSSDNQLANVLFDVLFPIYTVKETNENG